MGVRSPKNPVNSPEPEAADNRVKRPPGILSPDPAPSRSPLVGWAMAVAMVAYAAFIHHGLGGTEMGRIHSFWQPTSFLRETEWVDENLESWIHGLFVFGPPAILGLALLVYATRSAVARAIGICSLSCVVIMIFYGLSSALQVWEFFHWRASVVILVTGVALGLTLSSPLLVERGLRLPLLWQAVLYLPIFFAIVSVIRNATGSDENLAFNFSPWPAIPLVALEVGAYGLCGLMLGLSLGLGGAGLVKRRSWLRWLWLVAGCLFPVFWLRARFPQFGGEFGVWVVAAYAGIMALLFLTRSSEPGQERVRRAGLLLLGSCLVVLPLFVGRALTDSDYAVTRHIRAQAIIDALARYYEDEEAYPENLAALTQGKYIDSLPEPRIGFAIFSDLGWLEPQAFEYRNLGPNYVLEFSATAWAMCSYNPPWDIDEDEEEEEDWEDLGGAWSCPADRPDLW